MTMSDFKVLVIGGGSCGLALAQGLRKAGIPYTLYERDSAEEYQLRPRDWGSLLHWGQEYMQKCLPEDLWKRRAEMWVDPWDDYESHSASLIWNGKTGEEIMRPSAVKGTVRVSRRKVRVFLSQGLDIEYSKRLVEVTTQDDKVMAHFEDGTSATGSLLIGCDGGRSKVREYVVGPDAAKGFDSDYTMINTWTTLPAETALALRAKHPIISQAVHPDNQAGGLIATLDVPYKEAPPEEWKFQVYMGWKGGPRKADLKTSEMTMQRLKKNYGMLSEPFRSVGEAISDTHYLPVDDGWNFKPTGDFEWNNHNGKVALAGDAAHSMLPHRGQGLNNAIMDSAGLIDAVMKVVEGKQDLSEAIDEYEAEMRPRGSAEVDLNLQQMQLTAQRDIEKTPLYKIGFDRQAASGEGRL